MERLFILNKASGRVNLLLGKEKRYTLYLDPVFQKNFLNDFKKLLPR